MTVQIALSTKVRRIISVPLLTDQWDNIESVSSPPYPNPGSQSLGDVVLSALRVVAAGWALFFAMGYVLWWIDFLRHRVDFFRDGNALVFPWIFLPFFASAGLSAGFAIWGTKRPDLIGACGLAAMGMEAVYFIAILALDLATNPRPEYPWATKALGASMLGMLAASAWRDARTGDRSSWLPTARLLLSAIPSVLAIAIGSGAIEGWQKASHDKLDGWGAITTPVVLVLSVIATLATIALIRFTWQIQSRRLPPWAARLFPA